MTRVFSKRRRPFIESLSQLCVVLSAIAALVYAFDPFDTASAFQSNLRILTKGAAVGLLALFAFINTKRVDIFLLALALSAGMLGDVLISAGARGLNAALFAFGAGHLFYILLFLTNRLYNEALTTRRLRYAAILWGFGGFGLYILWPLLVTTTTLMQVYLGLLFLMTTLAILSRYSMVTVGLGALSFFISDLLLGFDLITDKLGFWAILIWPTYYMGQFLLTMGVILAPRRQQRIFSGR